MIKFVIQSVQIWETFAYQCFTVLFSRKKVKFQDQDFFFEKLTRRWVTHTGVPTEVTFFLKMSAKECSYDRYSTSKILILILSDGVKIQIYK